MKTPLFAAVLLIVAAIAVSLTGCGGSSPTATTPPAQQYLYNTAVDVRDRSGTVIPATPYGFAMVPSGAEVRFTITGSAFPVAPMGGVDLDTVTWLFRVKNEVGSGGNYIPCVIPLGGKTAEGYQLYCPIDGNYIVTGKFPSMGVEVTTAPLNFIVGPWRPSQ